MSIGLSVDAHVEWACSDNAETSTRPSEELASCEVKFGVEGHFRTEHLSLTTLKTLDPATTNSAL